MRKYGVIGNPIKHSFSPSYFTEKFRNLKISDCEYSAFELKSIDELSVLLSDNDLSGVNVTMPFKQSVIHHLHHISEDAVKVNAVNTVKVIGEKLYGYNTDIYGFRTSLTPLLGVHHKNALIFGNGGSSAAVKYVLRRLGIAYKLVSRNEGADYTYDDLTEEIISKNKLLINTTPLGMEHRLNEAVDIPYSAISEEHLCYDLIYFPSETLFLSQAKKQGATIKNGLQMLELQADRSWEIWNM